MLQPELIQSIEDIPSVKESFRLGQPFNEKGNQLAELEEGRFLWQHFAKFNNQSESDASSVRSMMRGHEPPNQFDKENNYYKLFWKKYFENEQMLQDI